MNYNGLLWLKVNENENPYNLYVGMCIRRRWICLNDYDFYAKIFDLSYFLGVHFRICDDR